MLIQSVPTSPYGTIVHSLVIIDHLPFQELESVRDRPVIRIPLCNVRMSRRQVTSHQADRRVIQV